MNHRRRGIIALAICAGLGAFEPAVLQRFFQLADDVRFAAASAIAWPMRRVAKTIPPHVEERAAWRERAAKARALRDAAAETVAGPDGAAPVVGSGGQGRYLFLGVGRAEGVRTGMWAAVEGVFVGFVDRVERRASRVLVADDPRCTYSGAVIALDDETGEERLVQHVLLRGGRGGVAVPKRGLALRTDVIGQPVVTRTSGDAVRSFVLGHVRRDETTGGLVIRLAEAADRFDFVELHDEGRRIHLDAPEVKRVETEVVLAGDVALSEPTVLIDAGTSDGVYPGAVVSFEQRLFGRVVRAASRRARVRVFDGGARPIEVLHLKRANGGCSAVATAWNEGPAPEGCHVARGRGTLAPRGMLVADAEGPPWVPGLGDSVRVHLDPAREDLAALGWRGRP